MNAPVFVDTNVLIYALDNADLQKQEAARRWRAELWKSRLGRVSYQVLQEFYVKVTSKWPKTREAVRAEIRDLLTWKPVPVDASLLEKGWKIQERYGLSFWDAMIVAAASFASCRYLLTEDLQAGQELDGVIVTNPFLHNPDALASG
jgi:predicted nucleic acid-binding protein